LTELFWCCARHAFNVWGADSIGLRKGWKIVTIEGGGEHPLLKLLGGIIEKQ